MKKAFCGWDQKNDNKYFKQTSQNTIPILLIAETIDGNKTGRATTAPLLKTQLL